MYKIIKQYWLDLIVAVILLLIDIRLFLLFLLFTIFTLVNYFRRLIRVFHIANEVKILAIMKKINVNPSDAEDEFEKMKSNMTKQAIKDLEDDFKGIINPENLK